MNTTDFQHFQHFQQDTRRILDIAEEHKTTNLSELEKFIRTDAPELYGAFVRYSGYILRRLKERGFQSRPRRYKNSQKKAE